VIERQIEVETADGTMTTFIYHPDGDGPHPVVLYLMDAPSIRPALKDMARRLAGHGYYVMLPFLFYRGSPYKEFGADDAEMHQRRELMKTVTRDGILVDAAALLGSPRPIQQHATATSAPSGSA
jgi:carboxymethylenebutenolidase